MRIGLRGRGWPGHTGRVSDLAHHRLAVERGLAAAGLDWDAWPAAAATAPLDPATRLSALLLLIAPSQPALEPAGEEGYVVVFDLAVDHAIDRVRRRRLPWTAATARLALQLTRSRDAYDRDLDERRVAVALRAAELVCAAGDADLALLDELAETTRWLDGLDRELWRVPELQLYARRVAALAVPPELLDLSLLDDVDGWGPAARDAARALPAAEVAPLVRLLGELGPRRPTERWRRAVRSALEAEAARDLLRTWLRLAAETDLVRSREAEGYQLFEVFLFAPGNVDVARATVLATALLPSGPEDAADALVLGMLARRGAAGSGVPYMTEALALKVAVAAVDALAARGGPAEREVLGELLEDLGRRDLVKRVGALLGREEEARAREEQLRRDKAAAVRRVADPAPQRERAEIDKRLRRRLGPTLRELGFTGGPRTWRRFHDDRVDVVQISSAYDSEWLSIGFGTWWDLLHAAPGSRGTQRPDRERLAVTETDVRVHDDCPTSEESLATYAGRLRETIVPFLDGMGRYELVVAFVTSGAGLPPGAEDGEPVDPTLGPHALLGLLALEAGDRPMAVAHLARQLAEERRHLQDREELGAEDDGVTAEDRAHVAWWAAQLDRARRLPDG